jgi:hypothetical protein
VTRPSTHGKAHKRTHASSPSSAGEHAALIAARARDGARFPRRAPNAGRHLYILIDWTIQGPDPVRSRAGPRDRFRRGRARC